MEVLNMKNNFKMANQKANKFIITNLPIKFKNKNFTLKIK